MKQKEAFSHGTGGKDHAHPHHRGSGRRAQRGRRGAPGQDAPKRLGLPRRTGGGRRERHRRRPAGDPGGDGRHGGGGRGLLHLLQHPDPPRTQRGEGGAHQAHAGLHLPGCRRDAQAIGGESRIAVRPPGQGAGARPVAEYHPAVSGVSGLRGTARVSGVRHKAGV